MKVLIVEDEAVAARQLKAMVQRLDPELEVLEVLDTIEAVVAYFGQQPAPDLLFLDIELADGQSFEIFGQVEVRCSVIFTTAYDEYALKAFEVNSVDYLLKPIEEAALGRALQKFRNLRRTFGGATAQALPVEELLRQINGIQRPASPFRDRFLVHVGQRLLPVEVSDAAYFFASNKLTFLRTYAGQQYPLDYSLEELERMLDPRQFHRINRQYIVSHKAIQKVHLYFTSKLKVDLRPSPEEEVIISREKAMAFRHWLGE